MKTIDELIDDILRREGGYVDHKDDKGGATNLGITQKTLAHFLGHDVSKEDVKCLTKETASKIYKQSYYLKPGIDDLPESIQPFILDCSVNHGPKRAIKFVQQACNDAGYANPLTVDGYMGPNTANAAKITDDTIAKFFLRDLIELRKKCYYDIVENDATQHVFLAGWLNRAKEFEHDIA